MELFLFCFTQCEFYLTLSELVKFFIRVSLVGGPIVWLIWSCGALLCGVSSGVLDTIRARIDLDCADIQTIIRADFDYLQDLQY